MKAKKSSQPTKRDKDKQKKIEERVEAEKVKLDHPKGKERFEKVVRGAFKKGSN